eukprot:TRINITY_DN4175_c0_g1_i1.p1 TRINITY_DN4175_c0_g1~~TRINITY_DN4175_c0_g1_i1.p1  ORF type:complete len:164 (+),score=54.17 TRINITY_DN4175_c0_g1_i1:372-863(+)
MAEEASSPQGGSSHSIVTVGIAFGDVKCDVNGKRVHIVFYDTAGHERFRALTKNYFHGCDGCFLVVDCSNLDESVRRGKEFKRDFDLECPNVPVVLLANKSDLCVPMGIDLQQIRDAVEPMRVPDAYVTSAKTGRGIKDALDHLLNDMIRVREVAAQADVGGA